MFPRSARISIALLVTLLASFPGGLAQAAGAGVRMVIHLETPVATMRCPECVIAGHGALIRRAVNTFETGQEGKAPRELGRFIHSGATVGDQTFSGTAVDLREVDPASDGGARRFIAL